MGRVHQLEAIFLALFVCACGATNTGNPDTGELSGPAGIEVIRSPIARDSMPLVADDDRASFGSDSRAFALELYSQAAAQAGNVFMSPYSIRVALGMLYAGARGDTRSEMTTSLRFGLEEPTLHAAFNATDLALSGRPDELVGHDSPEPPDMPATGDLLLRVVNAAFGQSGLMFETDYLDTLAIHYGGAMYGADFASEPDRERRAINAWVERQTAERIKDLLPQGSIDRSTVLVLANAIYFKGSWLTPFDAAQTRDETFHAPTGDVSIPMMNGYAEQYAAGDGYAALELPYIAPAVRMLFVLPDEGRFDEIEAGLDQAQFDAIRGSLSRHSVVLKLPKFSFDSSFELRDALRALGMVQAFDPLEADLSGITGGQGLYVSKVLHKAFVALDEQGTEAAAATAIVTSVVSAPPPADFFADRPFLFFIYDEPTGQILFAGRVVDPS